MSKTAALRLAFIGFGEAGQAIAHGLREAADVEIAAWDILFPQRDGQRLADTAGAIGVRVAASAEAAVQNADVVISAVTAASSHEAARSVASHLRPGTFFLDINSVSPGRKQETAHLLGEAIRYVDVAVMGPIHPARHRTPMLLAGPHAQAVAPLLASIDMSASIAGEAIGAAAAIKMVRSVMVKGMEALTLECFVAAARAGVERQVMASLAKSFPGFDWQKAVGYNLERMANHGARRAAEMDEVADTLRELGVEPLMASATARRQREMGEIGGRPAVRAAIAQDGDALLKAVSTAAWDRN